MPTDLSNAATANQLSKGNEMNAMRMIGWRQRGALLRIAESGGVDSRNCNATQRQRLRGLARKGYIILGPDDSVYRLTDSGRHMVAAISLSPSPITDHLCKE